MTCNLIASVMIFSEFFAFWYKSVYAHDPSSMRLECFPLKIKKLKGAALLKKKIMHMACHDRGKSYFKKWINAKLVIVVGQNYKSLHVI